MVGVYPCLSPELVGRYNLEPQLPMYYRVLKGGCPSNWRTLRIPRAGKIGDP